MRGERTTLKTVVKRKNVAASRQINFHHLKTYSFVEPEPKILLKKFLYKNKMKRKRIE